MPSRSILTDELIDFWTRFKSAPGAPDWDLVLAGTAEVPIPKRDDVHYVGRCSSRLTTESVRNCSWLLGKIARQTDRSGSD